MLCEWITFVGILHDVNAYCLQLNLRTCDDTLQLPNLSKGLESLYFVKARDVPWVLVQVPFKT